MANEIQGIDYETALANLRASLLGTLRHSLSRDSAESSASPKARCTRRV